MDASWRVPPAVSAHFGRLAYQVCNGARLDYKELPSRASEMVTSLEHRWRKGIDDGLTTEAAETKAIEWFGDLSIAIKRLQEPWYCRLFLYERSRWARLVVFVAAFMFYSWLTMIRLYIVPTLLIPSNSPAFKEDAFANLEHMLIPLTAKFFTAGFGSPFLAIAIAALAALTRSSWLARHAVLKHVWSVLVAISAIYLFTMLPRSAIMVITERMIGRAFTLFLGLHIIALIVACFGVACVVFEVYGTSAPLTRFLAGFYGLASGASLKDKWLGAGILAMCLMVLGFMLMGPIWEFLQYQHALA